MAHTHRVRQGWLTAVAVATAAAGCQDGDGRAADRLYPGPCTATNSIYGYECTMRYDGVGRLTLTDCTWTDGTIRNTVTRVFAGDELTAVARVTRYSSESGSARDDRSNEETWTFGDTVAMTADFRSPGSRIEIAATHERDGFQFLGHPLDPLPQLASPDSLIAGTTTTTTGLDEDRPEVTTEELDYSYDGPPRQGTRTRAASDGDIDVFRYDEDGRLVQWTNPHGEQIDVIYYEYDGELLGAIRDETRIDGGGDLRLDTTFDYDSYGNLSTKRVAYAVPFDEGPDVITEFAYRCW